MRGFVLGDDLGDEAAGLRGGAVEGALGVGLSEGFDTRVGLDASAEVTGGGLSAEGIAGRRESNGTERASKLAGVEGGEIKATCFSVCSERGSPNGRICGCWTSGRSSSSFVGCLERGATTEFLAPMTTVCFTGARFLGGESAGGGGRGVGAIDVGDWVKLCFGGEGGRLVLMSSGEGR
jgi:hypothetical protein